jgi:HEPN domain-containing protein
MDRQSEHAKQWIEKAKSDLLNADNNLAARQVPYDTVCFHCQQAAEKLLKGFLVARGCEYPITHNLFVLLEKVLEFDPAADSLREMLALLNPYSVEVRYPGDAWMPTSDDTREARQAAQEVFNWMQSSLEQLFE